MRATIFSIFFLTFFTSCSCLSPFYKKTGEKKEELLDGWTRTISYKKKYFYLSKNMKQARWPTYSYHKSKKYTYDSRGQLRKLTISKYSSFGLRLDTRSKTKEYNENGKRIRNKE